MRNIAFALLIGGTAMLATPAAVAQQSADPAAKDDAVAARDLQAVSAEAEAYARWLLALDEAATPANVAAQSLTGEWGRATQSPNPTAIAVTFRPVIAQSLQTIAGSRVQVAAMDTPDFPSLDLPADLTTTGLRLQMLQMVDQLTTLIAGFDPLLDAMANNDGRATMSALSRVAGSTRTLYQSQLLFARAALATTERDTLDYAMTEFDMAYFETGSRLIESAGRVIERQRDPTLSADLLRLADRMDHIIASGARAAAAQKRDSIADIGVAQDAESRQQLDRLRRIDEQSQRAFGLWRDFAATIRRGGAAAATSPAGFPELQLMTDQLAPLRASLDDIALAQIEIMAGRR